MLENRGDYFWFGSIFIYKNNQIDFKKKQTKTNSNRPVSIQLF
jgi:hypothetical protein